ncbi:MAG: hypothetical protein ABIN58_02165, partial [candidate division WOR-3 bacterium]
EFLRELEFLLTEVGLRGVDADPLERAPEGETEVPRLRTRLWTAIAIAAAAAATVYLGFFPGPLVDFIKALL